MTTFADAMVGGGGTWTEAELDRAWEGVRRELERKRWEEREARRADVRASEAWLERQVELRIGDLHRETPDIESWSMETGLGYQASIQEALAIALTPYGPHAVKAALSTIKRHRVAFGTPGIPDRCVVVGGRAALLELKRPKGGVVSDVQREWHTAARRRGVFVTVIRSADEVGPALARARAGATE